jgi:hypothetical protein
MKLILTENQVKILIEAELYYDKEQLPRLIEEIKKDIIESKSHCSKFLNMLKSLTVGDIMDNGQQYSGMILKMKKVHDFFSKKSNKFYVILNTFENDFGDKVLQEFDKMNSDLDTIQNDMDTIISDYNDIVENVLNDNGSIRNKYKYLNIQYSGETKEI